MFDSFALNVEFETVFLVELNWFAHNLFDTILLVQQRVFGNHNFSSCSYFPSINHANREMVSTERLANVSEVFVKKQGRYLLVNQTFKLFGNLF